MCTEETVLKVKERNVRLMPGVAVQVDTWNLHRSVEHWGLDAKQFKPERSVVHLDLRTYFQVPDGLSALLRKAT